MLQGSPQLQPKEQRSLQPHQPRQAGNQNPHISPNARSPTRTQHLRPRGLHPSRGAQ